MAEGYYTSCFQSTIDEDFKCGICLCVLKDPMQCVNNEHYFCSSCIKQHLEKTSHTCPTCNEKLTVETLRKAPRIVADCISRLMIHCYNSTRGCEVILELAALENHLKECDFMPVTCSNDGCSEVVNKRDVKRHELELCPFKPEICNECGKNMPRREYGAHGCVLRRDVEDIKKDLAEMKSTQQEMMNEMGEGMRRIMIAIENLEKASRSLSKAIDKLSTDMIVIGGFDTDDEVLNSVERFNIFNNTWAPMPELKSARGAAAAVLFENQIIVLGGIVDMQSDQITDSIEVLDMSSDFRTWQSFPVSLPIKVAGHKCFVYQNRLLIIGGAMIISKDGQSEGLNTIYEMLLVPPYWTKLLCRMKKPRFLHGAEIFDDKVLIVGGQGAETDVEIFDIKRNECTEMPALPSPVFGMATVRQNDTMLLIGGGDEEENATEKIIEYNFRTGQSNEKMIMKNARASCTAVYHEDTLVVVGGDPVHNSVESFNFSSNSWNKLSAMNVGRDFAASILCTKTNFDSF